MFNNGNRDMGEVKYHSEVSYDKEYMNKDYQMKDGYGYSSCGYGQGKMETPYMNGYMGHMPLPGVVCGPVYECPQIKVCHREIIHEVPHIQPVETKIINHHVYKHSYAPTYSCSEENIATDVYEPYCGGCSGY